MKKALALLLALVLTLSLTTAAFAAEVQPTSQNITIDGEAVYCPAYNIDGYNYVKLRTLASLLRETESAFDVTYDEATQTVTVKRGKAYTGPVEEAWIMVDLSGTAVPSAQTIVIDGAVRSDLSVWNLGGNNWFRLADLAKALGFGLTYDSATNTAAITTKTVGQSAAEYAQVYKAITTANGGRSSMRASGATNTSAKEAVDYETAVEAPAAADETGGQGAGDYSGTNVQVAGIDEGDIVKTDGKYIYVIHDEELVIFKADGQNTDEVSRTEVGMSVYSESDKKDDVYRYYSESKYPSQMFVGDGRLALISEYYKYDESRIDGKWVSNRKNYICVDFYDVSDPAAPKLTQSLGQDGYIMDTRLMDGRLYVMTSYWVWNCEEGDPSTYVPVLYKGGEARIMAADKIYINPWGCDSTEYVVGCGYDMSTGERFAEQSALGCGDRLYMNAGGIYVLGSHWFDNVTNTYTESVYTVEEHLNGSETQIIRFSVDDLSITASGKVPGSLESQFSADEYEGYLRLVTTRNDSGYKIYKDETYGFENYKWDESKTTNALYVLDGKLQIVGKVEDLAPGERVYSARFDGPIAYFCTFRNMDPLFAADISDPTAPKILSALKISGFSEYLHGWSADRLFGLGNEADEEDGWREELKLVMFDTSDKTNVTVKHTLVLEDADYSEALYNHKAVFIDPERNYIGFAAEDTYYIFSYDDAAGFQLKYQFDSYDWMGNTRGLRIGDYAYIVEYDEIIVISMTDWTWVKTLALDEAVG